METSGKIPSIYPACRAIIGSDLLQQLLSSANNAQQPEDFPDLLRKQGAALGLPEYLGDLARLEWAYGQLGTTFPDVSQQPKELVINPTLELLELSWQNLTTLINRDVFPAHVETTPGSERVLLWRGPKTGQKKIKVATSADLLVFKMAIEGIDPVEAANVGGWTVAEVDRLIRQAREQGLLLAPLSRIRRDPAIFAIQPETSEELLSTSVFTLQWHITQRCDLHCKHCYDRSERTPMPLENGLAVLNDLYHFCSEHNVRGQVSFSGGNPLLYPYFVELYQAAVDKGFEVAILGNPAPREQLAELLAIREPVFFQVSLEGLEDHNDIIRGPGHFQRVMGFLQLLRDLNIYSMVMLTLTRDNMAQVLPLAEVLRDKVDLFTFNRLAMVGEGAVLQSVKVAEYKNFLEAFMEAAETNPCLRLKDNLINIVRHQRGQELFGGCAGHGCGAAFNFLCALPDGELHACRKFPSLIGNIYENSITDLYDSEKARQYRAGCLACRNCKIRPVCGGCLAVAHGFGLNIFEDRDPYCFIENPDNRHD